VPAEKHLETPFVKPIDLGMSHGGEKITGYSIGWGSGVILVLATIRGNQPAGEPLALELKAFLEKNRGILAYKRVVIIPNVNPDGKKIGQKGNKKGIDINRNFPARFVPARNHGKKAGSEPETRAILKCIEDYSPMRIINIQQFPNRHFQGIDADGKADKIARHIDKFSVLELKNMKTEPGSLGSYAEKEKMRMVTLGFPMYTGSGRLDDAQLWERHREALIAGITYPADPPEWVSKEIMTQPPAEDPPSSLSVPLADTNNPSQDTLQPPDANQSPDTIQLGIALYEQGRYQGAYLHLRPFAAFNEEAKVYSQLSEGILAYQSGDYKNARAALMPVSDHSDARTHLQIMDGVDACRQGNYQDAVDILSEAAFHPNAAAKLHLSKGMSAYQRNDISTALNELSMVKDDPIADEYLSLIQGMDAVNNARYENGIDYLSDHLDNPEHEKDVGKYLFKASKALFAAGKYDQSIIGFTQLRILNDYKSKAEEYLFKCNLELAIKSLVSFFQLKFEDANESDKNKATQFFQKSMHHKAELKKYQTNCHACLEYLQETNNERYARGRTAFSNRNRMEAFKQWLIVDCLDPEYPAIDHHMRMIMEWLKIQKRDWPGCKNESGS